MDVLFRFFSPGGRTPFIPVKSGSRLAASASSNQALRTGFRAIMLLWLRVRDSNLKKIKDKCALLLGKLREE